MAGVEQGKDIIYFQTKASEPEKETSIESARQEAFNEETGEINWDCPCLGPMVQEPCGDTFKEAFSCFVYSKEEPKGSDCIEQFREMQKCFQAHPEIYGAELAGVDDDEDEDDDEEEEESKEKK